MEQTRKKTIWIVLAALIVLAACTIFTLLLLTGKVTSPQESSSEEESSGWLIYIDRDDSADSVRAKSALGWRWDIYNKVLAYHHHTGRYRVEAGSTCLHLYRQLRNGIQEPIKLVIPTSRTMEKLAATLSQRTLTAIRRQPFLPSSFPIPTRSIGTSLSISSWSVWNARTTASGLLREKPRQKPCI